MNLNDYCTFGEFINYVSKGNNENSKATTDWMMQKLLRTLTPYQLSRDYAEAVMAQIMANLAINPNEENFKGHLGRCPQCGSPVFARYKVAVGNGNPFKRIVICSNLTCDLIDIADNP